MNPYRRRLAALAGGLALAIGGSTLSAGSAGASTTAPDPPANFRAIDVQPTSITVTWDEVAGATEYGLAMIPLEPFDGYRRVTTTERTATFDGLMFDVPHKLTVRAFVRPAYPNWYTETATITVRTAVPEGYSPPSAPTNLQVERDAEGRIERVRWDAAQGFGALLYELSLDTDVQPELSGIWAMTGRLSVDSSLLPFDDGIFMPGEEVTLSVTARDVRRRTSPPSEPVIVTCCPF